MADQTQVCNDLTAEHDALVDVVSGIGDDAWDTPTPAEDFAVRDQVAHLAYFDDKGRLAVEDPDGFAADRERLLADFSLFEIEHHALAGRPRGDVVAFWAEAFAAEVALLRAQPAGERIAWFGPPMSAASFATARLMEHWAHGQDVLDAVGLVRPATDRLHHVAHLGVITRGWSYTVRGRVAPEAPVRVELAAPSGGTWTWGPEDAEDVVRGDAEDFCLVVTQRRHRQDTGIETVGPLAAEWMSIAQCFAGPPGPGRPAAAGGEQPL